MRNNRKEQPGASGAGALEAEGIGRESGQTASGNPPSRDGVLKTGPVGCVWGGIRFITRRQNVVGEGRGRCREHEMGESGKRMRGRMAMARATDSGECSPWRGEMMQGERRNP